MADRTDTADARADARTDAQADNWSRFRLAAVRSPLMAWRLAGSVPDMVSAPADEPWFPAVTPVSGFAEGFYLGRYRLAGRLREQKHSPFVGIEDAPADWVRALHEFGWLRPLRDEGTPLARANARALLNDWIEAFGDDLRHPAWEPVVAARRLDAWLAHHDWLAGGDAQDGNAEGGNAEGGGGRSETERLRDRQAARHVRTLRLMAPALSGTQRVEVGAVLAFAQTAFGTRGPVRGRSLAHVQAGMSDALSADGGPRSGCPRDAVRLLALLVRLEADRAKGVEGWRRPPFLDAAVKGLAGWLATLRHADGTIAQFGGTGWLPSRLIETLFEAGSGPEPDAGGASGFVRLTGGGGAVAIVDRGRGSDATPFDGGGAFELSVPKGRIVVSCGVPEREGPLREALRGSAAHSTLTVELPEGDAPGRPESVGKPESVEEDGREGQAFVATRRGPLLHRRRLRFTDEGLAGIDEVEGPGGTSARLRFHLHPDVTALRENGHAVSLTANPLASTPGQVADATAPGISRWTFHCVDAPVRIEETMVFAETPDEWSEGRGRPASQIVVDLPSGDGDDDGTRELRWMFVRQT